MIVAGGHSHIIFRVFRGLSNAKNRIRFGPQIRKLWEDILYRNALVLRVQTHFSSLGPFGFLKIFAYSNERFNSLQNKPISSLGIEL